ncbi:3-dehydroquinate dehydratase, type II [Meredithblackwellia eburnea MCA 4105]
MLSGVNHNLFGERDPKQYGSTTLAEIEQGLAKVAKELGVTIVAAQTNSEGEMVDLIHYARCLGGVIMNPGAFAHYSYALHDAIDACTSPVVEVHISNVYAREEFRHKSVTARVSSGYIAGAGIIGYELGLRVALQRVEEQKAAGKA